MIRKMWERYKAEGHSDVRDLANLTYEMKEEIYNGIMITTKWKRFNNDMSLFTWDFPYYMTILQGWWNLPLSLEVRRWKQYLLGSSGQPPWKEILPEEFRIGIQNVFTSEKKSVPSNSK